MILTTFMYLCVFVIGFCITCYGYEWGHLLAALVGSVIMTVGVVGGANEIIFDVAASTPNIPNAARL